MQLLIEARERAYAQQLQAQTDTAQRTAERESTEMEATGVWITKSVWSKSSAGALSAKECTKVHLKICVFFDFSYYREWTCSNLQ